MYDQSLKLLFYRWNGVTESDALDAFAAMGIKLISVFHKIGDYEEDAGLAEKMDKLKRTEGFDAVFSFNYFPVLSKICQELGIRYLSWVYDSPHFTLYSKTISNSCNRVFLFDYLLYEELCSSGIETVHYLPLAVNTARLKKQEASYGKGYLHEVSFVGNTYNNAYNFYDQIRYLPEYLKGWLDACIEAQMQVYGYDFLPKVLDDEKWEQIFTYVKLELGPQYLERKREMFLNMLRRKITVIERQRFLEMIGNYFPVTLYSGSKTPELPMVTNLGYADYMTKMPEVFLRSKINLNISLRSILSGIPLRVLDIMGAGGFCLSNYQAELAEYFETGKDLVWFDDLGDCLEKISYYLEHDEERRAVAESGRKKVNELFSYERQLGELLRISAEGY